MVDGSPTNSIATGTSFQLGNFLSTAASSGYFAGLPTQFLGTLSFTTTSGSSFAFGNGTFETFVSSSITTVVNSPGNRQFLISDLYTAGSFNPSLTPDPTTASINLIFSQTPVNTGLISASATMSIPFAPVPEPSTLAIAGAGLAGVAGLDVRRRRRRRMASDAAREMTAQRAGGAADDSSATVTS
jgi:hypothetical protein